MFELDIAVKSLQQMWRTFEASLPRLVTAVLVLLLSLFVARLLRWLVHKTIRRNPLHQESLRIALSRITYTVAIATSVLIAATIAFPSFTVGSLIQLLGVGGVVVGFAFKDIFQNFLAGILLLATNPFRIGDQIVVDEFEGTVEEIQARATFIRTFDRRRVVVPNADLFTKSVIVNTAYPQRRVEYDYEAKGPVDVEATREHLERALKSGVEGVDQDPVASVLVLKIAEGSTTFRMRWFSPSERGEYLIVQDRVLRAVEQAMRDMKAQQG